MQQAMVFCEHVPERAPPGSPGPPELYRLLGPRPEPLEVRLPVLDNLLPLIVAYWLGGSRHGSRSLESWRCLVGHDSWGCQKGIGGAGLSVSAGHGMRHQLRPCPGRRKHHCARPGMAGAQGAAIHQAEVVGLLPWRTLQASHLSWRFETDRG